MQTRIVVVAVAMAIAGAGRNVEAQSIATLQITTVLVDTDLNVKPVPRHVFLLRAGAGEIQRIVTGLDGKAQIVTSPGDYTLESERPVDFQGKSYKWKVSISLSPGQSIAVELSIDNAVIETLASPIVSSDLPTLFRRWQGSVVQCEVVV